MQVYIFRHGKASFGKNKQGDDPSLNSEGVQDVKNTVDLCSENLGFSPTAIVASPLARAKQTAELAKKELKLGLDIIVDECLYGDKTPSDVYSFLSRFSPRDKVVLVSHMPLIFELLHDLTGGKSNVELLNGSIACVAVEGKAGTGKGKLDWLVPPPDHTK